MYGAHAGAHVVPTRNDNHGCKQISLILRKGRQLGARARYKRGWYDGLYSSAQFSYSDVADEKMVMKFEEHPGEMFHFPNVHQSQLDEREVL